MPDIINRIKLEAQGADQTVREIRKLRDAYKEVATAAEGISPASVGTGDPFAKATAPNTGVKEGGQSSADVKQREERNRYYKEQSRKRAEETRAYNAAMRAVPGQVGGALSTAEAAGAGRGGAAVGGLANVVGGLLGGPGGMALMAAGVASMGIQRFAESAFGRMENVFGTGMSQRLGATYADTQNYMTEISRSGVPVGMVNALMAGASGSGAQFTRGTAGQFGLFADIAAGSGADASLLGQLLGASQRAGVDIQYGTFAAGAGAFGRGSLNTFLTELSRTIETAMSSGIALSQEEINRRGNVLAAYADIGGLSATGAVALNQMATQRAQGAAQLGTPEDIIAFQAMRQEGESITDTLQRMEENPTDTNRAVLSYLQRTSGGDRDLLRRRVRGYLGTGTTFAQVDAFIRTQGADISTIAGEGITQAGVRGKMFDAENNLVDIDPAREVYAARQIEALKGVEDASLELTTMLGNVSAWIMGNPINTDARNVQFGGVRRDLIESTISEVNEITAQDVSNLSAEIQEAQLNIHEARRVESFVQDPRFATNASTLRVLRENEPLQRQITDVYASTPGFGEHWQRVQESGFEAFGPGMGSFQNIFEDVLSAIRSQITIEAEEGLGFWARGRERREAADHITPIMVEFLNRNVTTAEQLQEAIRELVARLTESGYVFTDGGIDIPTRND